MSDLDALPYLITITLFLGINLSAVGEPVLSGWVRKALSYCSLLFLGIAISIAVVTAFSELSPSVYELLIPFAVSSVLIRFPLRDSADKVITTTNTN
jgi:hypothetical protein